MILKPRKSELQKFHELQAALEPQGYTLVEMPKRTVDAVDALIMLAKEKASPSKVIETEADWQVVEGIFKVWAAAYPGEYQKFVKSQKQVKAGLRSGAYNEHGITKDKGGASMQHQLNLPMKFDLMLNSIYPNQKLTRPFIKQLAKRFPMLRVPDKL